MTSRRALGAVATGVLAVGALTTTAPGVAAPASSLAQSAVCSLRLGSVTPGGDHTLQTIGASPTASTRQVGPRDLYPDNQARLPSSVGYEPVVPAGEQRQGLVALGAKMYQSAYTTDGTGTAVVPGTASMFLVAGGWSSDFQYVERSEYSVPGFSRANIYSKIDEPLHGLIARWTVSQDGWRYYTTYDGFKAVKTMALISQGRTYDTFLANTYGGALYTIQVPTGAGKPVVTKVRTSTWQAFDVLIAEKCGQQGTLLLGIDKDTGAGYVYAVGHANGAATVIQGRGKVPTTFPAGDSYFRYYLDTPEAGHLNGA